MITLLSTLKRRIKIRRDLVISKLRNRLIGKHGFAIIAKTSRGLFAVNPADMAVGRDLLRSGTYAEDELASIAEDLDENSRLLVVGTHIGSLLIPLASKTAEAWGIEANPDTFELLRINVALNRSTNVRILRLAAGNEKSTLKFLKNTMNSGGSKIMPKKFIYEYGYDNPEVVSVECDRLDDVLEGNFDHIIMDIEGSEVFALRGMPRILSNARTLRVEFLPHHLANVAGVDAAGFLEPISPFFDTMTVPSTSRTVGRDAFLGVLEEMMEKGAGDDGIIFRKAIDPETSAAGGEPVPNNPS